MKFIVDAQLPYHLSNLIQLKGFDSIHTDDLPDKERTSDNTIREICYNQDRIIVTKDSDFLNSYYFRGVPSRLLLITTGNIRNNELYQLVAKNFNEIIELFLEFSFVELSNDELIGHE